MWVLLIKLSSLYEILLETQDTYTYKNIWWNGVLGFYLPPIFFLKGYVNFTRNIRFF